LSKLSSEFKTALTNKIGFKELVWILSRKPQLDKEILAKIVEKVGKELHYPIKNLYYTKQDATTCKRN